MSINEKFVNEMNGWILTDDDSQQYVRPLENEDEFDLIEMSLINPETKEYIVYDDTVDVCNYLDAKRPELYDILHSFGYGDSDKDDSPIEDVMNQYPEASQVMAECIFEYYGVFEAEELFTGSEEECKKFIKTWILQH